MFGSDKQTLCVDCRFREMDGSTQIGCQLGILEQYRKNGVKIVEAYNDENDDYQEFYVIKDKFCPWYRGGNWVGKNGGDAKKEITSRLIDLIAYIDTEVDIDNVINLVKQQTVAPANFHLVLRNRQEPSDVYYKKILNATLTFPYLMHYITNPELTDGNCLNMVADKCSSYYYAVLRNNFPMPNDFVEKVFVRTYRQMRPFVMMRDLGGCIINTQAHKSVGGNSTLTVEEKLLERAEEQGLEHTIITLEDLYAE